MYPYNRIRKFTPIVSTFPHQKEKERKGAENGWGQEANEIGVVMISFGFIFPEGRC